MTNNRAVLITGTSTGIGKACALHLEQLGFTVYAGVRRPSDADRLKAQSTDRLKPILLDVTQAESIQSAADTIAKETDGCLFALINNAGIGNIDKTGSVRIPIYRDHCERSVLRSSSGYGGWK